MSCKGGCKSSSSKSSCESGCDDSSYEFCSRRSSIPGVLPFEPSSIENLILSISDKFDFRVMMQNEKVRGAMLVTAGFAIAGGLLGKAYGGKVGAAVGGAVGGACGLGFVAISMRAVWKEIRKELADVFDLVYDFMAGLGMKDYVSAAKFISSQSPLTNTLANVILQSSSQILGKQVLSSLNAAITNA